MSLGAQFKSLMGSASAFRQDAFGAQADGTPCQIEYNRGEFTLTGYYSPIRDRVKTEEAGFTDDYDSVVRIPKATAHAGFLPVLHALILVKEQKGAELNEIPMTIENILGNHPTSAEWILACNAAN